VIILIVLNTIHKGPFRVVSSEGGRYTLMKLITGDTKECHISSLRPFYFDNEEILRQTAMRDSQQWNVDFTNSRRKESKFKDNGEFMTKYGNHTLGYTP